MSSKIQNKIVKVPYMLDSSALVLIFCKECCLRISDAN